MVLNVPQSGIEVLIITGHMGERDTEQLQFWAQSFFCEYLKILQCGYPIKTLLVGVCLLSLGTSHSSHYSTSKLMKKSFYKVVIKTPLIFTQTKSVLQKLCNPFGYGCIFCDVN